MLIRCLAFSKAVHGTFFSLTVKKISMLVLLLCFSLLSFSSLRLLQLFHALQHFSFVSLFPIRPLFPTVTDIVKDSLFFIPFLTSPELWILFFMQRRTFLISCYVHRRSHSGLSAIGRTLSACEQVQICLLSCLCISPKQLPSLTMVCAEL